MINSKRPWIQKQLITRQFLEQNIEEPTVISTLVHTARRLGKQQDGSGMKMENPIQSLIDGMHINQITGKMLNGVLICAYMAPSGR